MVAQLQYWDTDQLCFYSAGGSCLGDILTILTQNILISLVEKTPAIYSRSAIPPLHFTYQWSVTGIYIIQYTYIVSEAFSWFCSSLTNGDTRRKLPVVRWQPLQQAEEHWGGETKREAHCHHVGILRLYKDTSSHLLLYLNSRMIKYTKGSYELLSTYQQAAIKPAGSIACMLDSPETVRSHPIPCIHCTCLIQIGSSHRWVDLLYSYLRSSAQCNAAVIVDTILPEKSIRHGANAYLSYGRWNAGQ